MRYGISGSWIQRSASRRIVPIAILILGTGACSSGEDTSGYDTRFVIGATATRNEPAARIEPGELDRMKAAVRKGTVGLTAFVGSVDTPLFTMDMSVYYDRETKETDTDPGRVSAGFQKNADQAQKQFALAAGQEPQLDVLGLLGAMSRTPGPAVLLIHTSGLQTTGLLDLRVQGSDLNVDATVARLRKYQDQLPDLEEKEVFFVGLGDVRRPQQKLTESMRKDLKSLWSQVCGLAHAARCDTDFASATGGDPLSVVPVPTVPVPSLPNAVVNGGRDDGRSAPKISLSLSNGFYFVPDTAEFRPEAATGIAEILTQLDPRKWTVKKIVLVGHCATQGPRETALTLSEQRARRVADALVAGGIDRRVFEVSGVGFEQPIERDLDKYGRLIPEKAEKNRTVVLTATRVMRTP